VPQVVVDEEDLAGLGGEGEPALVGIRASDGVGRDGAPQLRGQPGAVTGVDDLDAAGVQRGVVERGPDL
jgi:hypothetical protein